MSELSMNDLQKNFNNLFIYTRDIKNKTLEFKELVDGCNSKITGTDNSIHFLKIWIEETFYKEIEQIKEFKKILDSLRNEIKIENEKLSEYKKFSDKFEATKSFTEEKYYNIASLLEKYLKEDKNLPIQDKIKKVKRILKVKEL